MLVRLHPTAPISTTLDPSTPVVGARHADYADVGPFDQDTGIAGVGSSSFALAGSPPFSSAPARRSGRTCLRGRRGRGWRDRARSPGTCGLRRPAGADRPSQWGGPASSSRGRRSRRHPRRGRLRLRDPRRGVHADRIADPAAPTPSDLTGPGVDASRATVDLPAEITIRITETAATITALSNFGATLYGQPVMIAFASATSVLGPREGIVSGTPSFGTDGVFDVTNVGPTFFGCRATRLSPPLRGACPVAVDDHRHTWRSRRRRRSGPVVSARASPARRSVPRLPSRSGFWFFRLRPASSASSGCSMVRGNTPISCGTSGRWSPAEFRHPRWIRLAKDSTQLRHRGHRRGRIRAARRRRHRDRSRRPAGRRRWPEATLRKAPARPPSPKPRMASSSSSPR